MQAYPKVKVRFIKRLRRNVRSSEGTTVTQVVKIGDYATMPLFAATKLEDSGYVEICQTIQTLNS
jgi:hypothetical protein